LPLYSAPLSLFSTNSPYIPLLEGREGLLVGMTMGLVMLIVMLYGRFLPSVGMTAILKEKKGEEVWAATPPTLYLLSPSCGRHSDRREESITVIHWLLPLLFFPREGGWEDELVYSTTLT